MVDDDIVRWAEHRNRVSGFVRGIQVIAAREPDIADDDVVGIHTDHIEIPAFRRYRDAAARRGLSGDGDVGVVDGEDALEIDRAGHSKHDRAGAARSRAGAQRTRARIIEVCHATDRAATPADGRHARPFSARKCRDQGEGVEVCCDVGGHVPGPIPRPYPVVIDLTGRESGIGVVARRGVGNAGVCRAPPTVAALDIGGDWTYSIGTRYPAQRDG